MRATVSDIKEPVYSTGSPVVLLGFTADLRSVMNCNFFSVTNIRRLCLLILFTFSFGFRGFAQTISPVFQTNFPDITKPILIDNSLFDSILKANTYAEISKTDLQESFICWGISPLEFSEFSTARVFAFGRYAMGNQYHALIVFVSVEEIGELQFFIAVFNMNNDCVEFKQIAQRGGAKAGAFTDSKQHIACMLAGEYLIIMEIPLLPNQNDSSMINSLKSFKFSFEKEQFQYLIPPE